uniref:Uncharacterized protein n=1 Tax=Avena sativa TaxID=4498 RepID=A0ACD5WYK0_AVESA
MTPAPSTLFFHLTPSIKTPPSACTSFSTIARVTCKLLSVQRGSKQNTHAMGSLGPAVSVSMAKANGGTVAVAVGVQQQQQPERGMSSCSFQMPLQYPRYKKADYEEMPEWRLDCLLREYGLPVAGDVDHKRRFAMGAFLWPSQY